MRDKKIRELKILKAKLRLILDQYNLCKVKLENPNSELNTSPKRQEQLIRSKKFVATVELILTKLDPEMAEIIKTIYIKKRDKEELGYSTSTFYTKLRLAGKTFLKYLN
jgi:hypothetical protein